MIAQSCTSSYPRLALSEMEPFAKGTRRHCYVHPDNPNLCIKVMADRDDMSCHIAQMLDLEDHAWLKENMTEAVFERIPARVSIVDTDLGSGITMELYRDVDGRISRSLAQLVEELGLVPSLIEAIDDLKRWLKQHRLPTRDTAPYNTVAVRLDHDRYRLHIIEGWTNRKYRWLALRSQICARYAINRQLIRFDKRLSLFKHLPMT